MVVVVEKEDKGLYQAFNVEGFRMGDNGFR